MIHARGCLTATVLLGLLPLAAPADVTKPLPGDPKAFDKQIVDALRDVHNKGADLYNTTKDYAGSFRIYEGALRTVRPLLGYRPAAQKLIDDGLAASEKEPDPAKQAFHLHETIEKVRAYLKTAAAADPVAVEPRKPEPAATIPAPKPEPKKAAPVEPKRPETVTPKPNPKQPETQDNPTIRTPGGLGVSGKVTLGGKPLGKVDMLLASLTLPRPRVFATTTKEDGTYAITETVPPGPYVVVVTGKDVPARYSTTTTSGITTEVKAGGNTVDIALQ